MITPEQTSNVDSYLKSRGGQFDGIPDYATFSQEAVLNGMQDLRDGIVKETDTPMAIVDDAHQRTVDMVEEVFSGSTDLDIGRIFMVTRRANRNDGDEYASESRYHFPLAVPEFGVSPDMRIRSQIGLPPFLADTYTSSDRKDQRGGVMIAPLYADMMTDLDKNTQTMIGYQNLAASVEYAHKLGANAIGLGALLPKMTRFGTVLDMMDGADTRTTTTGHGGTVYLISETVKEVLERPSVDKDFKGQIGVLGAVGSIGSSTVATLLAEMPNISIQAFDTNKKIYDLPKVNDKVTLANDAIELLKNNNVIVSAITDIIDLDEVDPNKELDLTGKVIIDDSQPGCFHRSQVEARNGKIVWVVGKDESDNKFMTRDGKYTGGAGHGYNYGDKSGLLGPHDEFGCGIELAALVSSGELDKAIKAPVTPENARMIGKLARAAGAGVADLQSFGQSVVID